MKKAYVILFLLSFLSFSGKNIPQAKRPNIVVILLDDLGYSDLGCFGSEISTPNINLLASQGQIFSGFYAAATCSPSRAMLLTGTDHHIAGFGNMAEHLPSVPEQIGKPGYEGFLNNRVISVAQLLKDAGYQTCIAGKWHLGTTEDQSPTAKGFDRSFCLMEAAANHFYPGRDAVHFWEDGQFANYPDGQYSTDVYTDKMIRFIEDGRREGKPFFLYAAYTAPHWPLQAPPQYIEKYHGVYDMGYDSLRLLRFRRLQAKGLVPYSVALPDLPPVKGSLYSILQTPLLPWRALDKEQQRIEAKKMEIYAGMITCIDDNIGRLIQYLKKIGEYDNTFFVLLSDNGPDVFEFNETPDRSNPYPYMGTARSLVAYGPQWAHASSAVNRFYKGYSAEGGIHVPMIVRQPFHTKGKGIATAFCSILDLAPTFLDLAGVSYPAIYKGRVLARQQGISMLPFLRGERNVVHDETYVMGWELFGRGALRKGKWKITRMESPFGTGRFSLYDIENDPTESHNLAGQYPAKYREMLAHWKAYVEGNGVIEINN